MALLVGNWCLNWRVKKSCTSMVGEPCQVEGVRKTSAFHVGSDQGTRVEVLTVNPRASIQANLCSREITEAKASCALIASQHLQTLTPLEGINLVSICWRTRKVSPRALP